MKLSWHQIERVVTELAPRIVGGRIQKIRQPDSTTLCFSIYLRGETTHLIVSATPQVVRVSESESQGSTVEPPTALGMWTRKHAQGRRLSALTLDPDDRILRFILAEGTLVAELTGGTANLLGVDTDSILRCAARSVRLSLKLGDIYRPPPPRPTRIADHRKPTGSALDIEAEFQRHWSQLIERQEVQAVTRLLKSARTRLSKREQKISGDLARCAEADSLLKKGELLKGQLYKVGVKAEQVVLDDWYEEGTPTLVLTLDPRLDGPGNIEMLFKRYRKARDGAVRAETRMSEARSQRVELDALAAQDLDADSLRVSLSRMGLIGRQQSHGATTAITRKPYHEFVSCRGERILVGRGGADNHQTTFHVAKGNDHWLHTRDSPGAHVIVPCPNRGQSPHPETIKDAAALAIHHSRLRGEPGVAVSQTFRKHLRPIKGGAPGQVTVASAKTVFCDDMVVRIQRLYIEKRAQ